MAEQGHSSTEITNIGGNLSANEMLFKIMNKIDEMREQFYSRMDRTDEKFQKLGKKGNEIVRKLNRNFRT
jgi:hypothetical protein